MLAPLHVVKGLAVSPDGKTFATGIWNRTARLWDWASLEPIGLPMAHRGAVWSVGFSPDGRQLVTGSTDRTVRVWDVATRRSIQPPFWHEHHVQSVSFHPDGRRILTGTADGYANIWSMPEPTDADVERLALWSNVATGMEIDAKGAIQIIPHESWARRRGELEKLGGAPFDPGLARGDAAGAEAEDRRAADRNSDDAWDHIRRGRDLLDRGDRAGAEAEYRRAVALAPADVTARNSLGEVLVYRGDLAGAEAEYRRVVAINPGDVGAHVGLGQVLLSRGDLAGAEAEYRRAIEINPKDAWARFKLGEVLVGRGDLAGAEAEYRRVVAINPDDAKAHAELGWALKQQGRFSEALAAYRRGHELGSKQPGWNLPTARWVRDCERLVALEPRLPKVLSGEDRPGDDSEAIGFAYLCYHTRRYGASTRFYEKALAENPKLADDLDVGHRYNAACAAALAAAVKGKDEPPPDAEARAKLRARALDWLRAERDAWDKLLDAGGPAARETVASNLRHWRADPDLAGVRDPEVLAKLPKAERKDWRALWADVDAMIRRTGEPPAR
jgi:Flp pilus assembly protein TadD